jgi:hypothetical protein
MALHQVLSSKAEQVVSARASVPNLSFASAIRPGTSPAWSVEAAAMMDLESGQGALCPAPSLERDREWSGV